MGRNFLTKEEDQVFAWLISEEKGGKREMTQSVVNKLLKRNFRRFRKGSLIQAGSPSGNSWTGNGRPGG